MRPTTFSMSSDCAMLCDSCLIDGPFVRSLERKKMEVAG